MRTAYLETERRLVIKETREPSIQGPDQVLVQVKTVGICGSEVHAFHGTHPFRKAPILLGHEAAGKVLSVGERVSRFRPGDRVLVDPQWVCGECDHCRAGDINLCSSKRVLGTPPWPGAFGEYIVVPEETLFHLPDELSYVQGSLIEPLTVAVHVSRRAGLQPGESVAVLGTGSIGGLLAGVCSAYGATPVIVADIRRHCLDAARSRLGATHDILLPDERAAHRVREIANGEGADIVFICADDPSLVALAVDMARPRGRIVLVALMTVRPPVLPAYDIIKKELHLIGSNMSNHADVQEALALTVSGRVDVEAVATQVLPIEESERAMTLSMTKDEGAIKVFLTFEPISQEQKGVTHDH